MGRGRKKVFVSNSDWGKGRRVSIGHLDGDCGGRNEWKCRPAVEATRETSLLGQGKVKSARKMQSSEIRHISCVEEEKESFVV